jgi:hypothetical protein
MRRKLIAAALVLGLGAVGVIGAAPEASADFCEHPSHYGQQHIADGMEGGGWTQLGHKPGGHHGKAGLCGLGN